MQQKQIQLAVYYSRNYSKNISFSDSKRSLTVNRKKTLFNGKKCGLKK